MISGVIRERRNFVVAGFCGDGRIGPRRLGISPSAWDEAQAVMGERQAATVVAAILQRAEASASAGGYLRDLTRKAAAGQFSSVPMLMALIGGRKREKKRSA
jgi:replication initiation protein RepC